MVVHSSWSNPVFKRWARYHYSNNKESSTQTSKNKFKVNKNNLIDYMDFHWALVYNFSKFYINV